MGAFQPLVDKDLAILQCWVTMQLENFSSSYSHTTLVSWACHSECVSLSTPFTTYFFLPTPKAASICSFHNLPSLACSISTTSWLPDEQEDIYSLLILALSLQVLAKKDCLKINT